MGFFDDLDAAVDKPTESAPTIAVDAATLQPVLDELEGGWTFSMSVETQKKDDKVSGRATENQTRVWHEGGRFCVQDRLLDRVGTSFDDVHADNTRRMDRQGLIDLLGERPLLARKLLEAAGVSAASSVEPSEF